MSISKGHTQRRMSLLNASECKHHHPHHHDHQHRIINADEDGHADSRRWCWRWNPGDGGGCLFRFCGTILTRSCCQCSASYTHGPLEPRSFWLARFSLTRLSGQVFCHDKLKKECLQGCDSSAFVVQAGARSVAPSYSSSVSPSPAARRFPRCSNPPCISFSLLQRHAPKSLQAHSSVVLPHSRTSTLSQSHPRQHLHSLATRHGEVCLRCGRSALPFAHQRRSGLCSADHCAHRRRSRRTASRRPSSVRFYTTPRGGLAVVRGSGRPHPWPKAVALPAFALEQMLATEMVLFSHCWLNT